MGVKDLSQFSKGADAASQDGWVNVGHRGKLIGVVEITLVGTIIAEGAVLAEERDEVEVPGVQASALFGTADDALAGVAHGGGERSGWRTQPLCEGEGPTGR